MSEILNIIQNLYVINPFLCAVIIYLVLKVRQHEDRLKKFDTMKIESTLVEIKTSLEWIKMELKNKSI